MTQAEADEILRRWCPQTHAYDNNNTDDKTLRDDGTYNLHDYEHFASDFDWQLALDDVSVGSSNHARLHTSLMPVCAPACTQGKPSQERMDAAADDLQVLDESVLPLINITIDERLKREKTRLFKRAKKSLQRTRT